MTDQAPTIHEHTHCVSRARAREEGFTLVELVVSLIILAVLMAVAATHLRSSATASRINSVKTIGGEVEGATATYLARHPALPSMPDPLTTGSTWTQTQTATTGGLFDVDGKRLLSLWPSNAYTSAPLVIKRTNGCPGATGGSPGDIVVCRPNPSHVRVIGYARNDANATFIAFDHTL